MKTTIAEIKKLPVGTEIQGVPLLIKTARRAFSDGENKTWQEVVFMDVSGEMLGHVQLVTIDAEEHKKLCNGRVNVANYSPWKSKTNLCIMKAIVQATDDRGKDDLKLIVTDCFDTATPLTYDQQQDLTADDWQQLHDEEIAGKIRHGLVVAYITAMKRLTITHGEKNLFNDLVEFIKHG